MRTSRNVRKESKARQRSAEETPRGRRKSREMKRKEKWIRRRKTTKG